MGDTAVDFFQEILKQLITSSKLDLIAGEKHQLQSLEEEIRHLREFLKVTEKKRNEHLEVMNLVTNIRDVVSEAENVVELFVVRAYSLQVHQDHLPLNLERVKKEIKTLMVKVKHIYDENMYDVNGVAVNKLKHSSTGSRGGSGSSGGSTSKAGEEKVVVVGFEEEVKRLMEKLDDIGQDKRLEIISIIGAAGGGKTTLAREVYDNRLTSKIFEIRAWVDVSQGYDKTMKRDLLIRILERVSTEKHEDYEKSSEDMLGEKVLKCLKGKKYLIVMDDMWGIEAWNDIERSFPKEYKWSKVLFTSRLKGDEVVQPDGVRYFPHCLDPLPTSRSWELLQKKVFGKKCCPPELVGIGEQIAAKCEGLPLAIVAIAGILSTQDKTLDVWEEVAKCLSNSMIAKKQQGCMEILELSYNHLPLHLKACFLYIGAFPEDYEIPVRELIWLWIAEGFIQQSEGGKSLETVAKDCLIGLIDRSLVMVARKRSFGGIKACRIHDLLRALCLKKAEEDNFLVQNYKDDSFSYVTNRHRRLFIGSQLFHGFFLLPHTRNLRSLMCLSLPNSPPLSVAPSERSFLVSNFELLRVFSFTSSKHHSNIEIGREVHLRYLAIKVPYGDCFLRIPNYLNLETFNIQVQKQGDTIKLPGDIFDMVKLRHLYTKNGVFSYHQSYLSTEQVARTGSNHSSKLDSLQTLHRICSCMICRDFLVSTPNLKKLGVYGELTSRDGVLMIPDLRFLKCLETLSFTNTTVYRKGVASTLPAGLKFPPTITRLTLQYTFLKWEELSILQTLPSLKVLKLLFKACCGPVWNTCELEGFSQLRYLRFECLDIEEWNASEDQFSILEVLVLEECRKLEGIPIDFAYINELRKIEVKHSSWSAEESARKIQEDRRNQRGDDDCVHLLTERNFHHWNRDKNEYTLRFHH